MSEVMSIIVMDLKICDKDNRMTRWYTRANNVVETVEMLNHDYHNADKNKCKTLNYLFILLYLKFHI